MSGVLALVATLAADGELMATRLKAKNRREGGRFISVPCAVLESQHYIKLSPLAKVLLQDLHLEFRGNNNGNLCAAWTLMKPRGWRSKTSLAKARNELLRTGFIKITRRGDRRRPHLYALTFLAIDECNVRLDCAPTKTPTSEWKLDPVGQKMDYRGPESGSKLPKLRAVS